MITVDAIWRSLLEDYYRHAAVMAQPDADLQPLPLEYRATLGRIHGLASEGRPLELSDYGAFWNMGTVGEAEACHLLLSALEDFSRRPFDINDRAFLNHLRRCARYLSEQGYHGIEDDRNHWDEVVDPQADNMAKNR